MKLTAVVDAPVPWLIAVEGGTCSCSSSQTQSDRRHQQIVQGLVVECGAVCSRPHAYIHCAPYAFNCL